MAYSCRRSLNSLSDSSAPSSDLSEGSNYSLIIDNIDLHLDSLSLDTNSVAEITNNERNQIETFFSGLGTEVYVSSSLANLYEEIPKKKNWRLVYTGIPLLVYDRGLTRNRTQPRLTLILAERGTCFALWKDKIDILSNYKVAGTAFHTCLSSDHRKVIGFSFDSNQASLEFWQKIEYIISNPENISYPCQFLHVTKVTAHDTSRFYSLQTFVASSHLHKHY